MQFESLKLFWKPHDYQKRAMRLMLEQACLGLFLDPGLGKTSIALGAFNVLKKQGLAKRLLVIAPLRPVYSTWPAELMKWADFNNLRYCILHGPDKESKLDLDADVYLINCDWPAIQWLFSNSRWKKINADILCVDESTKFKNSQSQRFKLLRDFVPKFRRRWILTGTPAPNGLLDLFGQIYLLDEGLALGRYITHYRGRFFHQSSWDRFGWHPNVGASEGIAERLKEITLRMSAEEFLQMPWLIIKNIEVELPPAARKVYREMENHFITLLEDGDSAVIAPNAAVAGGKCRQIANGAMYTGPQTGHLGPVAAGARYIPLHDAKIEALKDLVEELQGTPLLVAYEYQHDVDRILKVFPNAPIIGGGVSVAKSDIYIRDFNEGRVPLLLGHPASMGHGLNLQGSCHHVCWFGIPWDLEQYDQTIRRVYRQGNKAEHVFIYHIVAKDTMDEKVLRALALKDRTQRDLVGLLQSVKSACNSLAEV
jgi:SNF2 family DNA or RNA helicase